MQHFDVNVIRRDFATLAQQVKGKPLIYLDNAATTHKTRWCPPGDEGLLPKV